MLNLTCWVRFRRKSLIHRMSLGLTPRSISLPTSRWGWMVSNELLKSINSSSQDCEVVSGVHILLVIVSSLSSIPAWYANQYESKNGETSVRRCFNTIFSKHYIGTEVWATGHRSFISLGLLFLGTGTIRDSFHWSGISPVSSEC